MCLTFLQKTRTHPIHFILLCIFHIEDPGSFLNVGLKVTDCHVCGFVLLFTVFLIGIFFGSGGTSCGTNFTGSLICLLDRLVPSGKVSMAMSVSMSLLPAWSHSEHCLGRPKKTTTIETEDKSSQEGKNVKVEKQKLKYWKRLFFLQYKTSP